MVVTSSKKTKTTSKFQKKKLTPNSCFITINLWFLLTNKILHFAWKILSLLWSFRIASTLKNWLSICNSSRKMRASIAMTSRKAVLFRGLVPRLSSSRTLLVMIGWAPKLRRRECSISFNWRIISWSLIKIAKCKYYYNIQMTMLPTLLTMLLRPIKSLKKRQMKNWVNKSMKSNSKN